MTNPPKTTPIKISYQDLQGNHHSQTQDIPPTQSFVPFPVVAGGPSVTRPQLGDWSMLAGRADEWFGAHLRLSPNTDGLGPLLSPWIFSAGHAVELYLKAALTSVTNLKTATDFRHHLGALWARCEKLPAFPFPGLVRKHLLQPHLDLYSPPVRQGLKPDDRAHIAEQELLYLCLRHVQDLKYLGTPGATTRNLYPINFGAANPNRPMIDILGQLSRWTWGQWCCQPGLNNPDLFVCANRLLK